VKNLWNQLCENVEFMRPCDRRDAFIDSCRQAKVFSFTDMSKVNEVCGWKDEEASAERFVIPLPFTYTGFVFDKTAVVVRKSDDDSLEPKYWMLALLPDQDDKLGGVTLSFLMNLHAKDNEISFEFVDAFHGKNEKRMGVTTKDSFDPLNKCLVDIASTVLLGNAYINHPDYMIVEAAPKKERPSNHKIRRIHERPEFISLHRTAVRDSWARATGNGAAKCPHMRRGHFKTLRAERWGPEKRGTKVWVRPCTIHGEEITWTERNRMYTVR